MKATISLLVPAYNASLFIHRLIQSIRLQEEPFDEVIFYDDASGDNTVETIRHAGFKVIEGKENKGPSFARNQLIKAASSEWVHFHDADDYLHAQFVREMRAAIIDDQTMIICNCGNLSVTDLSYQGSFIKYKIHPEQEAVHYFLRHVGLAIVGLYNKTFLLQNEIFFKNDLRYNEDPDFHVRLANAGAKFSSVDKELVFTVGHTASASSKGWWNCISNQVFCMLSYKQILPIQYHEILANNLASVAYYCIRSNKVKIAYRAIYTLEHFFDNNFQFQTRSVLLRALSLLTGKQFLRFCLYISIFKEKLFGKAD